MDDHTRAAAGAQAAADAPAASLACRVAVRDVDLQMTVPTGRRLAIVGPNGAGKSTALALLAGHLRPDAGRVGLHGSVVSSQAVHVPAHRRRVVSLEQRPGLFPHLTVLDNVAYGPRAHGVRRRAARDRALAELEAVDCAGLADRRPHELSGGQAQRVALARALAVDPELVLLDEPLAALDVAVAPAMRRLLVERLAGRTVVLVTHDPLDLWALAQDLVVVDAGRVVQYGPVEEVLARPAADFVARLAGVSLLEGVVEDVVGDAVDDELCAPGGDSVVGVRVDAPGWRAGARAIATVDPRAVAVHPAAGEAGGAAAGAASPSSGSARNTWPAHVVTLTPAGALTRLTAELRDGQHVEAELTSRSAVELGLAPGVPVTLVVKAAQVTLYPRP